MGIYEKWIAFVSIDKEERQDFLDGLHKEIQSGFEVVVTTANEEFKTKLKDNLTKETLEHLEISLAHLVYAGYFLKMIESGINILEANYKDSEQSALVGEKWMNLFVTYKQPDIKSFEKILEGFRPVSLGYLQLYKNSYIDRILFLDTYLNQEPYSVLGLIDTFFNWSLMMGYKLAQIEVELNSQ